MAGRYATALFELAVADNAVEAVNADLDRFDALVAENTDLERLLRSPVFTADEQIRSLSAVLDRVGIGELAVKFLKVLASNRRLFAVREVIKAFRTLVARHKGEVTAQVTFAHAPTPEHIAALKETIEATTKKTVQMQISIDPSIIGGLVVKLGSRMVDTSLRTKLNAIKLAMKEAG